MRAAVFAIGVWAGLAACHPVRKRALTATPSAGMTISLYRADDQGYGVVDDRRWVDVADSTVTLEEVDPAVPLASLVIEPLDGAGLAVGSCMRDALMRERAAVRCSVSGTLGRHLVRVFYIAPSLHYVARHDLTMHTDDKIEISTRYSVPTPTWGHPAEVRLFDGLPGQDRAPREVARGKVTLDGATAIIAAPVREVAAQLQRIYGAQLDEDDTRDSSHGNSHAVWVYLEMELTRLPAGAMHVTIDSPTDVARDLELVNAPRETTATRLRVPLWIDPQLLGSQLRTTVARGDVDLRERYTFTVTNNSDTTREIWVEQRLRVAKHRRVSFGTPKPSLGANYARVKLSVPTKQQARADFGLAYVF